MQCAEVGMIVSKQHKSQNHEMFSIRHLAVMKMKLSALHGVIACYEKYSKREGCDKLFQLQNRKIKLQNVHLT